MLAAWTAPLRLKQSPQRHGSSRWKRGARFRAAVSPLDLAEQTQRRSTGGSPDSSNRPEIQALSLAHARSRERQRGDACCPARVRRSVSACAAHELVRCLAPNI
jgi:hypothetical protein